jgi:xanthine dehydrogenase YagS FAD-binding subunit
MNRDMRCSIRPLRRGIAVGHGAGAGRARCEIRHQSGKGERIVAVEDFFIGPKIDITRMTCSRPRRSSPRSGLSWAGAHFYFGRSPTGTWDFALVNVAAAMAVKNGVIENCRIACGGVSAVPRRLTAVEGIVKGKPLNADIAKLAGQSATRGATPLNYNQFKIPLMANLVTRAVRDARA